jgi:hypothetical protein
MQEILRELFVGLKDTEATGTKAPYVPLIDQQ